MALLSSSSMYPLEPLMRTTSASESWQRISSIQQMVGRILARGGHLGGENWEISRSMRVAGEREAAE
ncbi:hypothetical protein L596_029533 [Steinernema carpocapsae]|uniref:Uncharacterized protein n=1 Tax=Steinernema carpocapsae TaxID=34508 RepID=A0A4U5LUW7_STECR|nr:hypothetical protein L596_029533 [Steinernema carpocapsae]